MDQHLRVITEPIREAVSLAEMRTQLQLGFETYYDSQLILYMAMARRYYERQTGRTMHETTYEVTRLEWPSASRLSLPRATPLIAVTSVTMTDENEVATVWSSSDYLVDVDTEPGAIVLKRGETWPSFTKSTVSPIRIRYTAGIPTSSPTAEAHAEDKIPILMLAAALFENRETEIVKSQSGLESIVLHYGLDAFINSRMVKYVV